MVRVFLFI